MPERVCVCSSLQVELQSVFSLALVFLAEKSHSNENVIPDRVMLSGEAAAVSPAFVSCLDPARYTTQVQKDETEYIRTGSIRQAGLDDAGLTVYDRPFIICHQLSAFSSLNY